MSAFAYARGSAAVRQYDMSHEPVIQSPSPTFAEALRFWLKLGFISFGGPTGQIAIMHQELVDRKRWIGEAQFLHALNFCMLLPGPEAQQLATYIGWLLHRTRGGIAAGGLFVLPSVLILWVLSYVYVVHGEVTWVAYAFAGLKPAVVAIVADAVIRIGRRVLKNAVAWALSAGAFVAIFFLKAPFPLIILAAGLIGLVGGRFWKKHFLILKGHAGKESAGTAADRAILEIHTQPSLMRSVKVMVICLLLWWAPIFAAGILLGRDSTITQEGVFFSKAAMVTFGGAYAVLPYVAQQAVERYGWLTAPQMLDGLGLAETTPGPLIMVVQFVGFVGAWNHPGSVPPLMAASLGAVMTTWVTFLPCFLWIFLGAPYVERMRSVESLTAALSAITAAVVGVVLNLAVWFAIQVLWRAGAGPDLFSMVVAVAGLVALVRFKVGVIPLVLASAIVGLGWGYTVGY